MTASTAGRDEPMREHLDRVRDRIRESARRAGRDEATISLLAVSKAKPAADIETLAELGQRAFGENYLQEALEKIRSLSHRESLNWHFIGPMQSNKTRPVAEHFHWVQTVDRIKIARRLSRQRPDTLAPLNVCIQVNISREPQKAGVLPEDVAALADAVAELPGLRLRGLMCLPAPATDETAARAPFRALREQLETLNGRGHELDTLSMGMSADLEAAVLEGSTMLRVGSALFGPRATGASPERP